MKGAVISQYFATVRNLQFTYAWPKVSGRISSFCKCGTGPANISSFHLETQGCYSVLLNTEQKYSNENLRSNPNTKEFGTEWDSNSVSGYLTQMQIRKWTEFEYLLSPASVCCNLKIDQKQVCLRALNTTPNDNCIKGYLLKITNLHTKHIQTPLLFLEKPNNIFATLVLQYLLMFATHDCD